MSFLYSNIDDTNFKIGASEAGKLNFNSSLFNLTSIRGMSQLVKDYQLKPEEIDIHGNAVESLLELQYLAQYVKKIVASNNQIEYLCANPSNMCLNGWEIKMSNLIHLDLSFNRLRQIPELTSTPNLKVLYLQQNLISFETFDALEHGRQLENLDLSGNELHWEDETAFAAATHKFKYMTKLKTLKLAGNKLDNIPNYPIIILARIRSKRSIGSKSIVQIDDVKINKERKVIADDYYKNNFSKDSKMKDMEYAHGTPEATSRGFMKEISTDNSTTIVKFNEELENCFLATSDAVEIVSNMNREVRVVMESEYMYAQLYKDIYEGPIDAPKAASVTEELLQNIVLLSERQPQLLKALLRFLVFLSTVDYLDLGKKCLSQLCDFVGAGENHAYETINVLETSLIPVLEESPNVALRNRVYHVILHVVRVLRRLDLNFHLMETLTGHIANVLSLYNTRKASEITDTFIEMMVELCSFPVFAKEFGALNFSKVLSLLWRNATLGSQRYIHLLSIIRFMTEYDLIEEAGHISYRSALVFVDNEVHSDLIKSFKNLADKAIKFAINEDSIRQELILCIAALSSCRQVYVELMHPAIGFVGLLGRIYALENSGPVILRAVFKAFVAILSAPLEWFPLVFDHNSMEYEDAFFEISRVLKNFVPLLEYLDPTSDVFANMCALLPEKEKLRYMPGKVTKLKGVTSVVMQMFFISVIQLIGVICQLALDGRIEAAKAAAMDMNAANREVRLFSCLDIPSDKVRIAVIECLNTIPLYEFDSDEIAWMVRMVSSVTNVGAGNEEKVLAGAFSLMSRICEDEKVGPSFREKFALESINATLSILSRNAERDTIGQKTESEEKTILSYACVSFLLTCAKFPLLKEYLTGTSQMELVLQILQHEDRSSPYFVFSPTSDDQLYIQDYYPTLIEQTPGGGNVEYLLRLLVGIHAVTPGGVVAHRVIRRIADVLCGYMNTETKYTKVTSASNYSAIHFMPSMEFKDWNMCDVQAEFQMGPLWNHCMGNVCGIPSSGSISVDKHYPETRMNRLLQHRDFLKCNGIERLIAYVATSFVSQGNSIESADPNQQLNYQVVDIASIVNTSIQTETVAAKENDSSSPDVEISSGKSVLVRKYMEEGQYDIRGLSMTLQSSGSIRMEEDAADEEYVSRIGSQAQVEKPNTRVLVAALRVLYSMLCMGNIDTIRSAKGVLRNPRQLKSLAAICMGARGSAEWGTHFIGAKFMAIAYELCVMSGVERETSASILPCYAIVCAAARRIIMTYTLGVRAMKQLSDAELLTMVHATRTVALVASQLEYLFLADQKEPMDRLDPNIRNHVMTIIWDHLIPLKPFLSELILFAGHLKSQPMKAVYGSKTQLESMINEHINLILVHMLSCVPERRLGTLRELALHQSSSVAAGVNHFRSSAVQEILNGVARARFMAEMRNLMLRPQSFANYYNMVKSDSKSSDSGGFSLFSLCVGRRHSDELHTRVARGAFKWNYEPAQALPRMVLNQDHAQVAPWEYERIGDERIITFGFVDVFDTLGNIPSRQLLVLTSESYYLYDPPRWGGGWSDDEANETLTNPIPLMYPGVISDSRMPVLLWKRPYRALNRLCLGMSGQQFYLSHRESDVGEGSRASTFIFLTYNSGVADRFVNAFIDMYRRWSEIEEMKTGNQLPELLLENDIILRQDAILAMEGEKAFNSVKHTMYFSTLGHSVLFEKDLCTLVQLVSSTKKHSKVILCTDTTFMITNGQWSNWSFLKSDEVLEGNNHDSIVVHKSSKFHQLSDLNEVMLDKGPLPLLTIGFSKKSGSQLVSTGVKSSYYYLIMFHDEAMRTMWLQKLLPHLSHKI